MSYGASHLGVTASRVAFNEGDAWLDQLVGELATGAGCSVSLIAEHLPGVVFREPEATYLGWLDCAALGLDDPFQHFLDEARVAVDAGPKFGTGGETCVRINFATSEAILSEAVRRMGASLPA